MKYWDNPEFKAFDVGDYVQDGLVVNYDGIRNQGPNAAHDPSATTWVNLGSWGSDYDMTKKGSPTSSYWADNGFYFDSKTWFVTTNKLSHGSKYEIEALVDAEHSKQTDIGYIFFMSTAFPRASDGGWRYGSIGIRKAGSTYGQNIDGTQYDGTLCLNTDRDSSNGAGTAKRPVLLDETFKYLTAIANETYASIFTGLDEPAGVPGRSGLASGRTVLASASLYLNLGGHNTNGGGETSTGEGLTGTIRNLRYYSTPLSREQRAWNRVVDEARYFHRRGALPVTNVVVAVSGIDGIADDHFAIDGEGYLFTAPTSRTVEGKRYVLGGYTLDTWNGSAWVADGEGTHTGNSVTVSDTTAKVRITWQYSRPAGEGQLAHYDVSDYEQDGLVVHFDGICNQGESAHHSNAATTWVNLGTGGSANNATLTVGTGGGNWTEDGYRFGGNGTKFVVNTAHTWHTNHTVQTLVDAAYADNTASSDGNYVFSAAWNKAAMPVRGGDSTKTVWFHTQGLAHNEMPRVANPDPERFTYATVIHNGTAGTACVFTGTEPPTSGGITTGFLSYESSMPEFTGTTAIGGWGGAAAQYLVGKVKNFRYYSRVLTNTELEHNRKVDEYRFFGRYVVTNVLVQSTYSYLDGYEKAGPYEVEGSYTFTAPESVTAANGITYDCDGYTVETQDGIGWAALTSGTGNSYLYNTSAGTVRLTWKWKATSGRRTAADYSIDDLSPAGLALHYDGIFNQGVGVARSTTATKWVNLGSRPGMDLSRATAGTDTSKHGYWGDDGYVFTGNAQFNSADGQQWATTFSAQVLVDAKYADNTHVSGNYIAATTWSRFGMQIDGSRKVGRFNAQNDQDYAHRPNYSTATGIDYMTAIHDAATQTAVVFPGTKAPTGGSVTDGYMHFDTFSGIENNQFRLGGWGGGPANSQNLVGTVKTFRYYDRVLTEEELIRNRNVDAVRYFGALAVTNVVVGTEAYKVEGSYTFTPSDTATDVAGYRLFVLQDNGDWEKMGSFQSGRKFDYSETNPDFVGKTIKLEWAPQPPGMMIIVK